MKRLSYPIKHWSFLIKFLVVVGLVGQSCNTPEQTGIVTISCSDSLQLHSYHNNLFNRKAGTDGKLAMFLSDYSFIVVDDGHSLEWQYLYRNEDGNTIELKTEENLLFVNDIVRSISLAYAQDVNFIDWYNSVELDDYKSIRTIEIDSNALVKHHEALQTIAKHNPNISFIITEDLGESLTLLPVTSPSMLFISDTLNKKLINQLDLRDLRVLITEELNPTNLEDLSNYSMPALTKLVLVLTEAYVGDIVNAFPSLQALSVFYGPYLNNVADINNLGKLQELHIVSGDTMETIDLKQAQELVALTLYTEYESFQGIGRFPKLQYLNPGHIDSDQLDSVLSLNSELVFLNLENSTVKRLGALENIQKLEGVVLGGENTEEFEFSSLEGLPKLKHIGLPNEMDNEQELIEKIRKACPNCIIYKYDGGCLGSGWLILFIPFLVFMLMVKKVRAKYKQQQV